ncbi:hypothetical protein GGI02_004657 [Coemansia sp. RSA 2322]|nr:hypothetical protein GGI02_004657 [Coemansia sp. RSA 2322]
MDAYEAGSGWFFWNFKTEEADDWNYIKLAQNGLIPNPPTDRHYSRYSLDNTVSALDFRRNVGDQVRGVNLGGLFVLEPWITPSLFAEWEGSPQSPVVDEWTYCAVLGKPECLRRLHRHWATWVQESDISTLASMHINTLRLPVGYWALAPDPSEPFVQGQVPYLRQILNWAAVYNMRVILDLHGVPGSQNGFDNSGRRGDIGWTKGATDVQRSLDSLAMLAQLANEHPSVAAIQAVNEPANWGVAKREITQFYLQAYSVVKGISPRTTLIFHDAFLPQSEWGELVPANMTGSYIDTHVYHVFTEDLLKLSDATHISKACADGKNIGQLSSRLPTICGEFSLATTDCARWLNGFQRGARWDGSFLTTKPVVPGGTCAGQEDMRGWSLQKQLFMRTFAMAQLQAYEEGNGWIFWNFKTETADSWNYIKLAQAGIIPNAPVGSSFGVCAR